MPHAPLPIDAVLPSLIDALRISPCALLRAPTGSGKTTRVPGAILDALLSTGQVVMLEPRRIAARAAARRIAFERQVSVGDEVGYQVRFENRTSARTRLRIVTDGILLRMLHDDPYLERVGALVFDEFHERGLNVDLALAMVRRVQETVRPDLKIVVMSATLETGDALPKFLGNCPLIVAEGRLFPVTVRHVDVGREPLPELAANGVRQILNETSGDILVFLPGVGEIRRTSDQLSAVAAAQRLLVLPLYGDLSAEQQDAVLQPADRRKVILATNVAETSLTIEGVTGVVDTGYARVLQFDAALGLDRLELTRISQASAEQRSGRAGRTKPGVCLRMWSEREHRGLPERTEPDIRRADLAGAVLQLRCWGEVPNTFPWFEAPRPHAVEQAETVLRRLGALNDRGVTGLGRALAALPIHPRLARLLLAGEQFQVADRAALAAALLSERDPFERSGRQRQSVHRSESDLLDKVTALEDFEDRGALDSESGRLHGGGARGVLRIRDQLLAMLRSVAHSGPPPVTGSLRRAVFVAFADRLARRREAGSRRGVMVGGRGVRLADESAVLDAELFVCVDVAAGTGESLVRLASSVERDWLPAETLSVNEVLTFDPVKERVTAQRLTSWYDLTISEVQIALPDDDRAAAVLAEAVGLDLERVLPKDNAEIPNFLARVRCLRQWRPNLDLPDLSDERVRQELPTLCAGCRSFADLRKANWLGFLKGLLTWPQLQTVEREAPERLEVPSGKRIALQYEVGRPPVLAVRIQDMFGLIETPRIAGGTVPVLLHLLAPNMRPQQVTSDLPSFWVNTYPQVRKDLRRRYPKHAWPEDPLAGR